MMERRRKYGVRVMASSGAWFFERPVVKDTPGCGRSPPRLDLEPCIGLRPRPSRVSRPARARAGAPPRPIGGAAPPLPTSLPDFPVPSSGPPRASGAGRSRVLALKREILISGTQRETRVAILEDDRLVELLVDRPDTRRSVGDIYLGRVEAVLPGIQAAFLNIGAEKSAFLHASDLIESEDEDEPGEPEDVDDEPQEGNGDGNGASAPPSQQQQPQQPQG